MICKTCTGRTIKDEIFLDTVVVGFDKRVKAMNDACNGEYWKLSYLMQVYDLKMICIALGCLLTSLS